MLTPRFGREGIHSRHSLALLGSLCFFLSAIEYLIPKPLPFMRIGLANMPLLLALDIFSPGEFFLLALLKILGQGIIGGMIFSHIFLFSIAGTFSSALVMFALRLLLGKKLIGFAGLGCVGAVASNCAQLLLARYLIFGPALRYLAAPFLASGLITGIGLGLICEYFCRHSLWYSRHAVSGNGSIRNLTTNYTNITNNTNNTQILHCKQSIRGNSCHSLIFFLEHWRRMFNAEGLFIAGLLMALIFMFNRSIEIRMAQFVFFCLLAFLFGKKINLFAAVLFSAGIVFFHLLAPFGKVLAAIGPLRITQGSLYAGIDKAITISGLVILSRVCIKSDLKLPGTIGSLLGESLRMLELLRERRGMLRRKQIISGLDKIMLEMETINFDDPENTQEKKQGINIKSVLLLISMVLVTLGMNIIHRG
jgi:heptaprenyl diphosphate synthase